MRQTAWLLAAILAILPSPSFTANAPPVGGNQPVQPTKTGNYTIKSTDLKQIIPFNCPSPCTVTFPAPTSSFPKGYPATIVNSGTTTVTVHVNSPSTVYGLPTTGGDVLLTAQGNYAVLTADKQNNYASYGSVGSGGVTPPPTGGVFVLRNGGGHVGRNATGGVLRNDTVISTAGLVTRNSGGHIARNGGGNVARN
jgi:hypothetical protein